MEVLTPNQVVSYFQGEPTVKLIGELAASRDLPCYLIGGAIRDVFLRGRHKGDLDFFIQGSDPKVLKEFILMYAAAYRGDPTHLTAPAKIDFTLSPNVVASVQQFDLTMHAVLLDCRNYTFLDPAGGLKDLQNRRLKIQSASFFVGSATSFFRPFRFAAEFSLPILKEDLDIISTYREMVNIGHEATRPKVLAEIIDFFTFEKIHNELQTLQETRLLESFFPMLLPLRHLKSTRGETTEIGVNYASMLALEALIADLSVPVREQFLKITSTERSERGGRFRLRINPLAEARLAGLLYGMEIALLRLDTTISEYFRTEEHRHHTFSKALELLVRGVKADPSMVEVLIKIGKLRVLTSLCESACQTGSLKPFRDRFYPDNLMHKQAALLSLARRCSSGEASTEALSTELFDYLAE